MLNRKTLDLLYKVTIRYFIDYALPIYANTLKQTEIARLERLQYRAAKVVTGALHFSSRDKLNVELGWETIQKRIEFLGLSLFHKIHLSETRHLIRQCLSKKFTGIQNPTKNQNQTKLNILVMDQNIVILC